MSLERVVRPFQTRDVTPERRVPTLYQTNAPNITLSFGKGGSGKVMHGSINLTVTLYMDTKLKEDIGGTINGQPASNNAINNALFNSPIGVAHLV